MAADDEQKSPERIRLRQHQCPECGGFSVLRALDTTLMELVFWKRLGYRAYSCRDCGYRFRDRPLHDATPR